MEDAITTGGKVLVHYGECWAVHSVCNAQNITYSLNECGFPGSHGAVESHYLPVAELLQELRGCCIDIF